MNREKFFERGAGLLAALGCCPAVLAAGTDGAGENGSSVAAHDSVAQTQAQQAADFSRNWVEWLLSSADSCLDTDQRVLLMETCGRDCARHGMVDSITEYKGRPEALIGMLREHLGADMAGIEGNKAFVKYPRCLCPLVRDIPGRLSGTWCNCSRGWIKEVFQVVTGSEAKVNLLESIKRGGKQCHFDIEI